MNNSVFQPSRSTPFSSRLGLRSQATRFHENLPTAHFAMTVTSTALRALATFNEDPAKSIEDLGKYEWNGTWYAIQRAEERFLRGRKCRGVPAHYLQTVVINDGILAEEDPRLRRALPSISKPRLQRSIGSDILRKRAIHQSQPARRSGSTIVVTRLIRVGSHWVPAQAQTSSNATAEDNTWDSLERATRSISVLSISSQSEHSVVLESIETRLRKLAEQPMAIRSANQTPLEEQRDRYTQVQLYDDQGKATVAWPLLRQPGLHDQNICGVEGFVSHSMYKPPAPGDVEPSGLDAYRAILIERNMVLLARAGCDEELGGEVLERALNDDHLGWYAVLGMAKSLAGQDEADSIGLEVSAAKVLLEEGMRVDEDAQDEEEGQAEEVIKEEEEAA